MGIQLLIPSARIVSEDLQNLGKLPAVVYPVNGHTVFSFIYKQYSSRCDSIKVLCYENAEIVHRMLKKYNDIDVLKIPQLGDLAHTIMYGLDKPGELIINFGDTIVFDDIFNNKSDSFYYAKEYLSNKWTYFEIKNGGVLSSVLDKKDVVDKNRIKKDIFVGVFYLSDALLFKNCIEESLLSRDESVSTFYQALQLYSTKKPLQPIATDNWFDIGHSDRYYKTKAEVKAREFNHISIDRERGILTKTSDDKAKFIGEIEWYIKLPSDVEYMRPRVFKYSLDYNSPMISMEYYAYHTVHELFLNSDLSLSQWEQIFKKIRFICNDLKRYKIVDNRIIPSLENMYLLKTIQRLEQLRCNEEFQSFFRNSIYVNGIRYKSLDDIIRILGKVIPDMLYDVKEFNIIHGDLCFANMMIDNNFSFIKVIDPRGKFGDFDIYGDFRYELAKLFHSIDGKYDYIIENLFEIKNTNNKIAFSIYDREKTLNLYKLFLSVFKEKIGNDLNKIFLIEALLFLSMISLHKESFNQQLVMLGTGLEILNRVVDIKEY